MILLTQEEFDRIVEVASRVAKRTGQAVVIRWDRVKIVTER